MEITDRMKNIKDEYTVFDGDEEVEAIKEAEIYVLYYIGDNIFENKDIDILIEKTNIKNKLFWKEVVKKIQNRNDVHRLFGCNFKKK